MAIQERRIITGIYQNPAKWEAKAIFRRARKSPHTQIICFWINHNGPPKTSGVIPYWIGGDIKTERAWIEDMTRADKVTLTEPISSPPHVLRRTGE